MLSGISRSKKWKILYIYTIDNASFSGYFKIGETSIDAIDDNWQNVDKQEIKNAVDKRIKDINTTAGISSIKLVYADIAIRKSNGKDVIFSDRDFHLALNQNNFMNDIPISHSGSDDDKNIITTNGKEWYKIDEKTLLNVLNEFREGKSNFSKNIPKINLREEQQEAVECMSHVWKDIIKNKDDTIDKFLIDAIMRFGKCITSYAFLNKNNIKKTLILSHKPVVSKSWKDDFNHYFNNDNDVDTKNKKYNFYTKDKIDDFNFEKNKNNFDDKNIIFFISIQDLRGRNISINDEYEDNISENYEINNESIHEWKLSNHSLLETEWDVLIFDEAHEGTLTNLAFEMNNIIKKKFSIFLSGTPFNIKTKDDFQSKFGNNIFTFDQIKECECKKNWIINHGTDSNPYADLPEISLNGVTISENGISISSEETGYKNNYFDFNLFFELDDNKFKDEININKWLANLTSDKDDQYLCQMPYHKKNRFQTLHSLWVLPFDVRKANALEELLNRENSWFKKNGYKIFNVAGSNYKKDDLKNIIQYTNDQNKCSITITIGRLTQGVTVPGWTSILMLDNTTSPIKYFQTIYRAKSPSPKDWTYKKEYALIFDFNPDRMLDQIYTVATRNILNCSMDERECEIKRILNYFNVMFFTDNQFIELDILNWKKLYNRMAVNRIVLNGFKSPDLIDKNKISAKNLNLNNNDVQKLVERLINKAGKSAKEDNFNEKLTDNSLDIAIIEGGETGLSDKDVDKSISNDKERQKQLEKIKKAINQIFTRIPYMLIGQSDSIIEKYKNGLKELTVDDFCKFFNDDDWREIMQSFEKRDFKEINKLFIDEQLFNSACAKYIGKINDINKLSDPTSRRDAWIGLFESIHNPDSETVLTPWKVVELQYKISSINWREIYDKKMTFIDINSKSAFYLLYAAMKIYETQEIHTLNKWRDIIFNNIYGICRTNLSLNVSKKILGFNKKDRNIILFNLINELESKFKIKNDNRHINEIKEDIMKKINIPDLKPFDFCICNPPYQLPANTEKIYDNNSSAKVIYDKFVMFANEISNVICMIFPAKWMTGGKGLNNFREFVLNSKHIKSLIDCENYNELFPTITLHSGLSILTIDKLNTYETTDIGILNNFKITNTIPRKLCEYEPLNVFIIDIKKYKILQKIEKKLGIGKDKTKWSDIDTLYKIISSRKPFDISSSFYKEKEFLNKISNDKNENFDIKIYYIAVRTKHKNPNSMGNRTFTYINSNMVKKTMI